jgi:LuxR family transcriptional activator of conjugal transfer of Ti plasmids
MYSDDFQLLIERLERSESKDGAVSSLSRYLSGIEIEHYAYLGFQGQGPRDREPFKAGSYPLAWVEEYMGDRLYRMDPVVLAATRSTVPLAWNGANLAEEEEDAEMARFFERASSFGIRSGYTIPIRSSIGQLATMTFASSMATERFRTLLGRRQAELHLGAFYFHDAVERLVAPARGAQLTPRERTCLMFSGQGLSATEIARLLDISPRSVKFHLDNSRHKLGAANLRQATSTATCLGLI